ncbi:MAG TPA: formate dehydrogenase accessory sulfurtransferase FdhD [Planctomycetaceae bacterium]|nr:formate dehydrogenase accessory sulfurtransferase FdhD [Planctomycetaceae bacterium]
MTPIQTDQGVVGVVMERVVGATSARRTDTLSIEEPLEIRLVIDEESSGRSVAVTMRTPGDDRDLAAGFLFTEGIVSKPDEIADIRCERCNVVRVVLQHGVKVDLGLLERHSFVASSCGVCGKRSIAAIRVRCKYPIAGGEPRLASDIVHSLPDALVAAQEDFASTGGIHGCGLFDQTGTLLLVREDVGRHNALDKLIGAQFLAGALPLSDRIVLVSGRASFELVQKAAEAGVPILAAVGAPSSLAVQLAQKCGMTLLGFVRNNRFNVYAGFDRIDGLRPGGPQIHESTMTYPLQHYP